MPPYKFIERRWLGSTYFNKYLFWLGIAFALYGVYKKIFVNDSFETIIAGIVFAFVGGFFPSFFISVAWVCIAINLFLFGDPPGSKNGWSLSNIPTDVWITSGVLFLVSVIIFVTSKHTGEQYEDVYEKEKKPWD